MTAVGGVPATVSDPRDAGHDRSLLVYSRSYALRLFPTPRRDGYTIASIYPLRLADHHRLAAGCLKLRPTQWETRFEIRQIPQGVDGYWPQVLAEWADCVATDRPALGASTLADDVARYRSFLDTLGRLIDATQKSAPRGSGSRSICTNAPYLAAHRQPGGTRTPDMRPVPPLRPVAEDRAFG